MLSVAQAADMPKAMTKRYAQMDANSDGQVDLAEYSASLKKKDTLTAERIQKKFDNIAGDDGVISPAEFQSWSKKPKMKKKKSGE